MQFKNLPALNSKEEANVVTILNRKLHADNPDGDKFEIPAEQFIYPQVDSENEAYEICGGKDNFLEVFNDHLRDSAVTAAKNKIRMASSGTPDDIIAAGIAEGKNFTFVVTEKITAAEAKDKLSTLRNIAAKGELSDEELAAQVRKLLGM